MNFHCVCVCLSVCVCQRECVLIQFSDFKLLLPQPLSPFDHFKGYIKSKCETNSNNIIQFSRFNNIAIYFLLLLFSVKPCPP